MRNQEGRHHLVSIIIPAYNEERYINLCLMSVLNQNYPKMEVILVDDGSTDLTHSVASQFRSVNIYKTSHQGSGFARNFGVKKSNGKIIIFIDSDMIIDRNFVKNIIKPIVIESCDATYTLNEYVANQYKIWSMCWNINVDLPIGKRIHSKDRTIGEAFRAIRKDKFHIKKGFNPRWGFMDDRSIFGTDLKVCVAKDALCFHNNPDSLKETFYSSRWIGRSVEFKPTISNLLKYSIINSIRNSIRKIRNGAPIRFLFFKIIFDLGIEAGILMKNKNRNYAK